MNGNPEVDCRLDQSPVSSQHNNNVVLLQLSSAFFTLVRKIWSQGSYRHREDATEQEQETKPLRGLPALFAAQRAIIAKTVNRAVPNRE